MIIDVRGGEVRSEARYKFDNSCDVVRVKYGVIRIENHVDKTAPGRDLCTIDNAESLIKAIARAAGLKVKVEI